MTTNHESTPPPVTGLSRGQFLGCLAVLVTIFMLASGPIWRHPWAMDSVNDAILWSYAPLPLLVLGCLAASRRLRWRSFFFDTLRLTFVKYSLTFAIALVLWTITDQPVHAATHVAPLRTASPAAATPTSQTAELPLGSLRGRVLLDDDRPAVGALVYLDPEVPVRTPAPLEPVRLQYDARGLSPRLAAVQVGQSISVRSADGRMHTLVAERADGAPLFNVPAMRSGAWSRVSVAEPHQRVTLRCTVHPRADAAAELVVLRHGAFALTDADGRFTLEVPAGQQRVFARLDDAAGSAQATIDAARATHVELSLRPEPRN